MRKCLIEFPNHNLFICYDNTFCYNNFMLSKYDNLYNVYDYMIAYITLKRLFSFLLI